MDNFMDRDIKRLNDRQDIQDKENSKRFGLMDKTVNELILMWINSNRDMGIEFEKEIKRFITNKTKLSVIENLKVFNRKSLEIIYKNNRLFFFGIDIILVGIILYVCKIGR